MDEVNAQSVEGAFPLEVRLWEKLYELQLCTETVDSMRKELLQLRHGLYHTDSLLETERRITSELRTQLKGALDVIAKLENEKVKDHLAQVQLQMNYNNVLNEKDFLMNEATTEREKCVQYKVKLEALENQLQDKEIQNRNLTESLSFIQNNTLNIVKSIHDNVTKLRREQLSLEKSCEETIDLNKRLQTVGLCAYAVHQKADARIKALQSEIISLSVKDLSFPSTKATLHPVNQTEHQKASVSSKVQAEQSQDDPSELVETLIRELEKSPNFPS